MTTPHRPNADGATGHLEDLIPSGSDECKAKEAAPLVGMQLRTFNRQRARLERWCDANGDWQPVPRGATRAWRRDRIIYVREWGGASQYGSDWSYSRAACARWRQTPRPSDA